MTVNGAELAQLTEFGAFQEFEATEGFSEFEQRRRTKYSKNIATGVSIGSGLEEGIDRHLK